MLTKIFGFNPKETKIRTEIMAGVTTFLTMAYILAVNPNILGDTGMDKGALFTTTALMAGLATIFMGVYAKLPLALAPGMGLNAFFAYSVCLVMGHSGNLHSRPYFWKASCSFCLRLPIFAKRLLKFFLTH